MVQCWSQTEPAEPTELGGEVKAYRSQVLPQMMLTQGPRGWGGYHVAQAQHVRGKERVTGKRGFTLSSVSIGTHRSEDDTDLH